jgi:hypothetical protein
MLGRERCKMTSQEQETTGCIYGITSDFTVAKVWVKRHGSSITLEHHERGTKSVEAEHQDKLVPHASQVFNLTKAFKIPVMFFDSDETKRKISELEGKAAGMKAVAQKKRD